MSECKTIDCCPEDTFAFNAQPPVEPHDPPEDCANLIPVMVNNTSPSGVALASGNNVDAWKAFGAGDFEVLVAEPSQAGFASFPVTLSYQFTSPTLVNAYAVTVAEANNAPTYWIFQGSDDGVTWVSLNTQTNISWVDDERKVFQPTTSTHLVYRLLISDGDGVGENEGDGTGTIIVAQFELFECECPTITLSPTTLPDGELDVAYSQTISASGGNGAVTFAVIAGTLPTGLSLASNGNLAGTPTVPGVYHFTVEATDASDCTGEREYDLAIPPEDCIADTVVSLDETIAYTNICDTDNGAFHFTSANLVNAIQIISLHAHFGLEEMWDGICPLAVGPPRVNREHPAGALIIGPFPYDTVIFAASSLYVDDILTINGVQQAALANPVPRGRTLFALTAGVTATVRVYEQAGAYSYAVGYLGVCLPECAPPECTYVDSTLPVMTDYHVPLPYYVHSSGTSFEPYGHEPWVLIDGDPNTYWYYGAVTTPEEWLAGTPGFEWVFEFSQAGDPENLRRLFGEYAITARGTKGPTHVRLQAADPQGAIPNGAWITLDTQIDLEWTNNETKIFEFSNNTAYRQYRLDMNCSYDVGTEITHLRISGCNTPDVIPPGWEDL